jgi:HSP20 family protein
MNSTVKSILLIVLVIGFATPQVWADDQIEALKSQIEALRQRVEELEAGDSSASKLSRQDGPQSGYTGQWDPFREMQRLHEEMNQMFKQSFQRFPFQDQGGIFNQDVIWNDNFDIKETGNGYELKLNTAGFDQNHMDIEIQGQMITISGQKLVQEENTDSDSRMSSRSFGSFVRSIPLPDDADTTRVETKKDGDLLTIKIPKKN